VTSCDRTPVEQLAELTSWTLLFAYKLTDSVPDWAMGVTELSFDECIKLSSSLVELIEYKSQLRSQPPHSPTRPDGFF